MDRINDEDIKIEVNGEKVRHAEKPTGPEATEPKAPRKPKKTASRKQKCGIITLIVGLVALIAGVVFLLINLMKAPVVRDADYLVQVGAWQMKDQPSVEWKFTETGKGTLTTNSHINDYDFIWAIDGDTLKIETAWLYMLNDEYDYKLDQGQKTLTLTSGEDIYTFVPATDEENDSAEES